MPALPILSSRAPVALRSDFASLKNATGIALVGNVSIAQPHGLPMARQVMVRNASAARNAGEVTSNAATRGAMLSLMPAWAKRSPYWAGVAVSHEIAALVKFGNASYPLAEGAVLAPAQAILDAVTPQGQPRIDARSAVKSFAAMGNHASPFWHGLWEGFSWSPPETLDSYFLGGAHAKPFIDACLLAAPAVRGDEENREFVYATGDDYILERPWRPLNGSEFNVRCRLASLGDVYRKELEAAFVRNEGAHVAALHEVLMASAAMSVAQGTLWSQDFELLNTTLLCAADGCQTVPLHFHGGKFHAQGLFAIKPEAKNWIVYLHGEPNGAFRSYPNGAAFKASFRRRAKEDGFAKRLAATVPMERREAFLNWYELEALADSERLVPSWSSSTRQSLAQAMFGAFKGHKLSEARQHAPTSDEITQRDENNEWARITGPARTLLEWMLGAVPGVTQTLLLTQMAEAIDDGRLAWHRHNGLAVILAMRDIAFDALNLAASFDGIPELGALRAAAGSQVRELLLADQAGSWRSSLRVAANRQWAGYRVASDMVSGLPLAGEDGLIRHGTKTYVRLGEAVYESVFSAREGAHFVVHPQRGRMPPVRIESNAHGAWLMSGEVLEQMDELVLLRRLSAKTQTLSTQRLAHVRYESGVDSSGLLACHKSLHLPAALEHAIDRAVRRETLDGVAADASRLKGVSDQRLHASLLPLLDSWPSDTRLVVMDAYGLAEVFGNAGATHAVMVEHTGASLLGDLREAMSNSQWRRLAGGAPSDIDTDSLEALEHSLGQAAAKHADEALAAWQTSVDRAGSAPEAALRRHFPDLNSASARELLREFRVDELKDLALGRLSTAHYQRAVEQVQQCRKLRLRELINGRSVASAPDIEWAVSALEKLPGWRDVKCGIEFKLNGKVVDRFNSGERNYVLQAAGHGQFDVFDPDGLELGRSDLFGAVLKALPDEDRVRVGLQIHQGGLLRQQISQHVRGDDALFELLARAHRATGSPLEFCGRTARSPGGCAPLVTAAVQKEVKDVLEQWRNMRTYGNVPLDMRDKHGRPSSRWWGKNALVAKVTPGRILIDGNEVASVDLRHATHEGKGYYRAVSGSTSAGVGFVALPGEVKSMPVTEAQAAAPVMPKVRLESDHRIFSYPTQVHADPVTKLKCFQAIRQWDSEAIALERIAGDLEIALAQVRLGHPKVTPADVQMTIIIHSEIKPCYSCAGLIEQFQARYPGIKLVATYAYETGPLRRGERLGVDPETLVFYRTGGPTGLQVR